MLGPLPFRLDIRAMLCTSRQATLMSPPAHMAFNHFRFAGTPSAQQRIYTTMISQCFETSRIPLTPLSLPGPLMPLPL
jgi:hypothetical protein